MSGFHLLSNLWPDSKNEWYRETTDRASNINIRCRSPVREEPQHTNTCGTNPAGQTALSRLPVREEPRHTSTCGTNPAGQTALGRSPVREEPRHTNTCGTNPAGQTALGRSPVREEPRHANTCGTNPAGQTALGRSPVREEPRHTRMRNQPCRSGRSRDTHACNQSCRPDHTRQVAGQGGAATHMHVANPADETTLKVRIYSTSSPLWMQSLSKHYKMPQV